MTALRTLVRYIVPLAIVTVIVLAPLWLFAFRTEWPVNMQMANAALAKGFLLSAFAWSLQLVLVAAAAPLVRSVAAGKPLAQHRALFAALVNVVRMALPCAAAIGAILVGGLALVVPALVLLVLLSLTGASEAHGLPAPLVDSVTFVRAHWKLVAAIVSAMVLVDLAIAFGAWKLMTVPFAKKLKPAQWATYGNVARIVAIGVVIASPIFATLLAAVRARRP